MALPLLDGVEAALEVTGEGNTLGGNACGPIEIDGWVAWRYGGGTDAVHDVKRSVPISMCLCVFTAEPAHKVAVVEIETKQCSRHAVGTISTNRCLVRRWAESSE